MKTALYNSTLLLAIVGAAAFVCHAQQRPCSSADANQADEAGRLRSWDALYRSYRRYAPRCDDGSIAEGYSESVARILVDHWNTSPRLSELAEDHWFQKFVLRHIDATMDSGDLYKIRERALHNCPSNQKNICGQLKQAAEHAMNE